MRQFRARRGQDGMGSNRTGKSGEDLYINVPVGTIAIDQETQEVIGDLTEPGQSLLVARGGFHGLGNTRFKSSTNRAPRQSKPGTPGEERDLHLELKVLADVGLLGLPNAGKSTLIRSISAARPKVADYPFTTLYPHLGVVRVGPLQNFVIADIPGLIQGASEGAGLGIRFLKHLSRTSLLLHLVDISPYSDSGDPVQDVRIIEIELQKYSAELSGRDRWLVLNKVDLIPESDRRQRIDQVLEALQWQGPVFCVSGISGEGTQVLIQRIVEYIESRREEAKQETSPG